MDEGKVAGAWRLLKQQARDVAGADADPAKDEEDSIYGSRLPYEAYFHYIDRAGLMKP